MGIRTVIATNAAWIRVDRPFTKNRFSDFTFLGDVRHQFIFPKTTLVDHIRTIGGSQIQCTVTDIPQLTSTIVNGVAVNADGNVNALATTSKSVAANAVFDKVTMDASGTLQDVAEVNIGDRIRLINDVTDWHSWKTRTVDKVDLTAGTSTTVVQRRKSAALNAGCATSPVVLASASRDTPTMIALARTPWLHKHLFAQRRDVDSLFIRH